MKTSLPLDLSVLKPAALLLALSSVSAHSATLLNDTFSDNERATQSLTGSAAWGFSPNNGGNTLSASTSALVYTAAAAGAAQYSTAYFTASGSPVTLAVGETISLNFDFTLSSIVNSADAFRFALLSSHGTRMPSGFSGSNQAFSNSAVFGASDGYQAWINPGGTSFQLREEFVSVVPTPFSGSAQIGTTNTTSLGLAANTNYSANISVTRSATGALVSSTINGVTNSFLDTSGKFEFDSVSFFTSTAAVPTSGTLTVDNVNVSVIPEPSAALLGGLGALALLRRRRNG